MPITTCYVCSKAFQHPTPRQTCSTRCAVKLGNINHGKTWSEAEDASLLALLGSDPLKAIAEQHKEASLANGWPLRSLWAVKRRANLLAHNNGLMPPRTNGLLTITEWAQTLGIKRSRLANRAKSGDLPTQPIIGTSTATHTAIATLISNHPYKFSDIALDTLLWLFADDPDHAHWVKSHEYIPDKRSRPVIVQFPDGKTERFESAKAAAIGSHVCYRTVRRSAMRGVEVLDGYRYSYAGQEAQS